MKAAISQSETFVDILKLRAKTTPEDIVYVFLRNGEIIEERLTFKELDQQSQRIADELRVFGTGARVLLVFPPGLSFVIALFGCFKAGAVAVPAYPPVNTQHAPRLESLAADAQASVALTTTSTLALIERSCAASPLLSGMKWLATDAPIPSNAGFEGTPIHPRRGDLAILQYTSGSTGRPKGVMLTHQHLIVNAGFISRWLNKPPGTPGVTWLPPYHDLGLMGGVLHPIYEGFTAIMMSPFAFLQRPMRWLSAISRYRATLSGAPNFAYDLMANSTEREDIAKLDLSCWQAAFCGAEPVRADTIAKFVESFGPYGFREEAFLPAYGLAEATLMVSAKSTTRLRTWSYVADDLEKNRARLATGPGPNTRTLVSCGVPPEGQVVRIVEPEARTICAVGTIGEIWVSGPNVSAGYWNRPAETEATFRAFTTDTREGPFLRTGDLGLLQDGELVVTGRLKDLVIIDGRNHYPHDLEKTAEGSHPSLRPGTCIAFSVPMSGAERLVVAVERRRHAEADVAEITASIRRAVSMLHGIQVRDVKIVRQGTLPKTSSGKPQRRACRQAYLEGGLTE